MEERKKDELTAEDIAEKIRARRARSRFGVVFLIIGTLGFLAIMGVTLGRVFNGDDVPSGVFGLLSLTFLMAAVGGGFADPGTVSSWFKRG